MTSNFLKALFGNSNSGYIHLWVKNDKEQRSLFFNVNETSKAADTAIQLSADHDVYVGMCLREEDLGPYKRGDADDISAVTCLYLDIDIMGPAHKAVDLPPDKDTIEQIFSGFLPCSLQVDSGHGIYKIWLLDKSIPLENEEQRENAKSLMKNFHQAAALLMKNRGYNLDNVSDLPRILRIPGTVNHKTDPVPVTYEGNGQRYTLDELKAAIKEIVDKSKKMIPPSAVREPAATLSENVNVELMVSRCSFLKHCVEDRTTLTEPEWFAMIATLASVNKSHDLIHHYSKDYPGYSFEETQAKIKHASNYAEAYNCGTIKDKCSDKHCHECPYNGLISSPRLLGQAVIKESVDPIPFPTSALPALLQDYVVEGSLAICCPPDFIAVPLLVCAGGIIGDTCHAKVKPGWTENAGLYAAVVAEPSSKKSPALKVASRFTREYAEDLESQYQDEMSAYQEEKEQYEKDFSDWERGLRDEKPRKPKEPQRKRLYTVEPTVEALAPLMEQNPQGIILIKDELVAWTHGMNQYRGGSGSDRQAYLSFWNGSEYVVDRKGKDPIILPRTFMGVVGCIPPDILPDLIGNYGQDGFVERLLITQPKPLRQIWSDNIISKEAEQKAKLCFADLIRIRSSMLDPHNPRVIRLSAEARKVFIEWYNQHFLEIEASDMNPILKGIYGKLPGHIARISLILQCCIDPDAAEICAETLLRGIEIGEYFKAHAKNIFGTSVDQKTQNSILNWMDKRNSQTVIVRDLVTAGVKGCKTAASTRQALDELVICGFGIWSDLKRGVFIRL